MKPSDGASWLLLCGGRSSSGSSTGSSCSMCEAWRLAIFLYLSFFILPVCCVPACLPGLREDLFCIRAGQTPHIYARSPYNPWNSIISLVFLSPTSEDTHPLNKKKKNFSVRKKKTCKNFYTHTVNTSNTTTATTTTTTAVGSTTIFNKRRNRKQMCLCIRPPTPVAKISLFAVWHTYIVRLWVKPDFRKNIVLEISGPLVEITTRWLVGCYFQFQTNKKRHHPKLFVHTHIHTHLYAYQSMYIHFQKCKKVKESPLQTSKRASKQASPDRKGNIGHLHTHTHTKAGSCTDLAVISRPIDPPPPPPSPSCASLRRPSHLGKQAGRQAGRQAARQARFELCMQATEKPDDYFVRLSVCLSVACK